MEVEKFRRIDKGSLIASFTVKLPSGMEVRECKLISSGNTTFIGFPQKMFEVGGEKKYMGYVAIPDRERNNVFQDAVMKCLEPYLKEPESQPKDDTEESANIPF